MASHDPSLLAQIEADVLSDAPLADALRKCVVLGGKAGSVELRDWATRELRGYQGEDDVPDYRVIAAGIFVDAITGNTHITGQRIGVHQLPDVAREAIKEELTFREGIGQIEALILQGEHDKGSVKLSLPGAMQLAALMDNASGNPWQHILAIYWMISTPSLRGLVDQVRTTLAELVAEMRAGLSKDEEVPSAALASQALHVAVHGDKARVTVTTAQSSGQARSSVVAADAEPDSPFWTRSRKVGAFVVGAATVVAAVVGVIQIAG